MNQKQEKLRSVRRFFNKRNSVKRICIECGENKPDPIFSEFCGKCRSKIL